MLLVFCHSFRRELNSYLFFRWFQFPFMCYLSGYVAVNNNLYTLNYSTFSLFTHYEFSIYDNAWSEVLSNALLEDRRTMRMMTTF